MSKTCADCKYVGNGSEFYQLNSLCKRCYHKQNGSPYCSICHKYCNKDDIHKGHIICDKCWDIYERVKQLVKDEESDESSDEYPMDEQSDCKTQ